MRQRCWLMEMEVQKRLVMSDDDGDDCGWGRYGSSEVT